jgi:hypothetical protein
MAPRRAPAIDLTNPGAWTEAQATPPAASRPAAMSVLLDDADGADDQLDAIIQRRAVND